MDDREVEQALRAGLADHADEADLTAPVIARARDAVARRRRTRWGAAGAAAAVVLVIGGVAVVTRGGDESGKEPPSVADSGTTDDGPAAGWRTEYYGGVAVDVPADWGYGGAPLPSGRFDVCAPGGPPGYVGRPIVQTDVCIYLRSGWQPTAPYVWLGGNVDPGTYEWDNGYVQETVEVAGTTVTVGSDDAGLRDRILASARAGDLCAATVAGVPAGHLQLTRDGLGRPGPTVLCAYRRQREGDFRLAYARALPGDALAAAVDAAVSTPTADTTGCSADEFVEISGTFVDPFGSGEQRHRVVVVPGCHLVDLGDTRHRLTAAMIEPWVDRGVRSVLFYFIGPQG